MTVEAVRPRSEGYPVERGFLYADYSPLGDNRNIIEMLKDFVSLTGRIIQLQTNNEKMASLLKGAESLSQDVIHTVNQIRTNTKEAIQWFHDKYPDALATGLHTSSTALLDDGSKSILSLLDNTEVGFEEQRKKYIDQIMSRIRENHASATNLMQSWLARDYKNFPAELFASFSTQVRISIDPGNPKVYSAHRKTSSTKQLTTRNQVHNKEKGTMQLSYMFRIGTSAIEFWSNPRKVSEFGIRDLLMPAGMKAPISKKLKHALRLGNRKNSNLVKEPEFIKVDDYYLLSAILDGEKTLSIQLGPELSKLDHDCFEITYDISKISNSHRHIEQAQGLQRSRPKINYKSRKNGASSDTLDILHISEIAQATDFSKILFCGTAILEKLKLLDNANVVASTGQLELLEVNDSHIIKLDEMSKIEFTLLFDLLNFVAYYFAPLVKSLKEKTPVDGELILRQEGENGNRKEFSVKLGDLKSQLPDAHYCGRKVAETLQL